MDLRARIPDGPIQEKWDRRRFELKLVNPANKRRYDVIVVGSGLAGGSAAATMAELGYNVQCFTYHDSPRRAHSIAAQGGINAAKNYQNDGDSIYRLFYDTVKGGDFRSREANVHRLAQVSVNIIDQCVAQGVPFAREYGGALDNRSFGGAQVSRTFYARGQTGQQLLLGCYSALSRQIAAGKVEMHNRHEMLDLIVVDGRARGIVTRDLVDGTIRTCTADAVVLATGGYSNVFYLSTNAMACNVTAAWRAYRRGAGFANPCYTQIHPTCIPAAGGAPVQADPDERVAAQRRPHLGPQGRRATTRSAEQIPESERDYYLERIYPSFGNLSPRDISSRRAKEMVDEGRGVGEMANGVYLDFSDAIQRLGADVIRERYGNLFDMYERITGENPYTVPMRIYPAPHYTMGGLWVDYHLMSTIPGLFVIGEANFSDHGANRLGASALMQGLADGYFILPYTIGEYLAAHRDDRLDPSHPECRNVEEQATARIRRLLDTRGKRTADSFHRELGKIVWDHCGMSRNAAGLRQALGQVKELREQFWADVNVPDGADNLNQSLENANRIGDFFELAELMCHDALERDESCGAHFREEHQTGDGEAKRDDERFSHAAVWEFTDDKSDPLQHREPMHFEYVPPTQRSYK